MAKQSDLFIPSIAVRFCEILPMQTLPAPKPGNTEIGDLAFLNLRPFEDNIRRKYVYVFSSTGSVDYGISKSTPGWDSRIKAHCAFQHAAQWGMDGVNPKPSNVPKPEQADLEIYIDHEGRMWPISITKTWDKPRHERPHPMWGKRLPTTEGEEAALAKELADKGVVGFPWLQLALADKNGSPRRYYFLLSPFRLGPAGLKAALQDIGTDGLSLWLDNIESEKQGRILGPNPETLKHSGQSVIPIVDPYNFSSEIYTRLFERALDGYLRFVGNTQKGRIPGVNPAHFDTAKNGGTIDDLYFIAGVLANLRATKAIDDEIDPAMLDEVLGGYGWELQRNATSCELAARYLGNWITGPAHAILDRAAIEDLNDPADVLGPDDIAGSFLYWWHKLRLMPNTITGAVAARQVLSDSPNTFDNPLRHFLRTFEKSGSKLDLECNAGQAALQVSDIVPDIVFLALLRFNDGDFKTADQLDPDKAEEKAQRIANLINNLGFLDTEIINTKELKKRSAAKDAKDIISTQAKNILKGGLYFADAAGKMTVMYMKGKLMKSGIGFQADEIKKIKDYKGLDTLGKQIKEMTQTTQAEAARLAANVKQAKDSLLEIEGKIKAFRGEELDQSLVAQYKAAEVRRPVLKKQIAEAESRVRLDELSVNQTRGSKGATAKTQQARVSHVAAQTRLRQSLERLDELSTELRRVEKTLVDGKAHFERVAVSTETAQKLTKELDEAVKRHGPASLQAKAASDRLNSLVRQQGAMDELSERARSVAKSTKEDIPRAMLYVSIMSFGIEMVFVGATLTDRNASKSDVAWAAGDFLKAAADLGKDALKVSGAASADWAKATGSSTFLKVRGTLTLSNATGVMAVLGVIGGAYNVVKYGAKGIDAFRMEDYSVMMGASLAVMGGVLGVVSAMGMTAAGLTASGVGVVGGILVAAGALIIYYTADSEWEYFAEHCYFAKDADNRNTRSAGKGEDHWLGKMSQPSGGFLSDGKWSVRAQREALVRLLSRYSISTIAGFDCTRHYKIPENAAETSPHEHVIEGTLGLTCVIDFQSLPFGASFEVLIQARHRSVPRTGSLYVPEVTKELFRRSFAAQEMNAGPETVFDVVNGKKVKKALVGRFAGNERPGFICIMLERIPFEGLKCLHLDIKTRLTLPDGSVVIGDREAGEIFVSTAGYHDEGDFPLAPTFAEKFEGAVDRGF